MISAEHAHKVLTSIEGKRATKAGFWEHVEEIVEFIQDTYPHEFYGLLKQAEEKRATSINKFHSTKDLSSRILGAVPPRLSMLINHIYKDDIPYNSYHDMWQEFFRRYPLLSYAEKI